MARITAKNVDRDRLRKFLERIRELRAVAKDVKENEQAAQENALFLLRALDEAGKGVDLGDGSAAFAQQNAAPENWDLEKLVPYLREQGMLAAVQTTFIDPKKLESEIQQGNISRAEVRQFIIVGKQPAAFVRFGKPQEGSVKL